MKEIYKTKAKRIIKKLIRSLIIAIFLVVATFIVARYGWKLFGFTMCDNVGIYNVTVDSDSVTMKGFTPSSFGFVVGYHSKEKEGELYIGVKVNSFLGVWVNDYGDFTCEIPVDSEIKKVYYKTGNKEELIWDHEIGMVRDKKN